ncbi:MAG: chorismate mutase [Nanoarchaeota archaeon]|nr:chorismate mutase [Nanoarchaeota archaeon]
MSLQEYRKKIDALDEQLLELVVKRLEICKEIAKYKLENKLPVQDQEREKIILQERIEAFQEKGFDDETFIKELFEIIIKKSKDIQQ